MTNDPQSIQNVDDAIAHLRAGGVIIVVDAQERENEGDFVCAAETVTPETVDFMMRIGRGMLCAPMSKEYADRLQLVPAVDESRNTALHSTHFLTQIDHVDAGTGVSAANRAKTIQRLADPTATPEEFVRPGHISPILAKAGGVLRRAGHTEATIDLLRLAGLNPVGCLIEICSQHSHEMADYSELQELSAEYHIPIISIEELIAYRRVREQLVVREVEVEIPTARFGNPRIVGYRVEHESQEPLAIVWGDLASADAPLVRMHSSCFTGDVIDSLRCDCGDQLHMAMPF